MHFFFKLITEGDVHVTKDIVQRGIKPRLLLQIGEPFKDESPLRLDDDFIISSFHQNGNLTYEGWDKIKHLFDGDDLYKGELRMTRNNKRKEDNKLILQFYKDYRMEIEREKFNKIGEEMPWKTFEEMLKAQQNDE